MVSWISTIRLIVLLTTAVCDRSGRESTGVAASGAIADGSFGK
jgi:hypothetical protein